MKIYENLWRLIKIDESLWKSMKWISMYRICFWGEIENGLYIIFYKSKRLTYLSSKEEYIVSTEKLKIMVFWKTCTLTCKTHVKVMCFTKTSGVSKGTSTGLVCSLPEHDMILNQTRSTILV